ncbi:hypothetical protein SAMN06264364_105125 [Quadrisphaera granulorum]|uniref:SpoVT-AbrB domain-containing protein n=1 Tax=Quadrisphaera granulorum TaxID=317664 RepID=A0A316AAI3_9ACTN|nr:hypothetical protein [Quadrisphaera granulorum]PWJ54916.1 hypothetical protein BXY45_105125 [Quadrisphaera granulorum]SZE95862.1 hypothetical protein SAMN06264364_105125 [Quadrisphaera granulorum]
MKLDSRRRPTIPAALLDAAGVEAGEGMVARVEGPGRIVLESTGSVLSKLQRAVTEGMAAVAATEGRDPAAAVTTTALEEVAADRAADEARVLARYPNPATPR